MTVSLNNYFITVFALCMTMIAIPICSASDWSQFQMDCKNTGWVNSSAPTVNPVLAWKASTSYPDYATDVPPVIAGGTAYILASGGSILAYDKNNGDLIWKKDMNMWSQQSSTPAYGDGKLFVAINDKSNRGCIFAFNATTGEELWNVSVTDINFECPITYYNHRLYIGEGLKGGISTKYYYCYHENGTFLWRYPIDSTVGFLWCGASVVDEYLVFPTHEGLLVSLDRVTGTLVDKSNLSSDFSFSKYDPGMFRASVAYNEDFVYVTSESGQSLGYVWKVGYNHSNGMFIDEGWCTMNGFSTSTPVIYNGRVYVGNGEHGYEGNMTCLDDSTGDLIWNYYVDDGVKCSPAVSVQGNEIYIYFTKAQNDGSLYCVNGSGDLMWEYNPPDANYILQGPAISENKVYFGTNGCCLYAIQSEQQLVPVVDFYSNVTAGIIPLNVQFTDNSTNAESWSWDLNGDGIEDSNETSPSYTYDNVGTYTVILTVSNSVGSDTETKVGYIVVENFSDWNPWNDSDSSGGNYITFPEVIEAYRYFADGTTIPETGSSVSFPMVIELYRAFASNTPM